MATRTTRTDNRHTAHPTHCAQCGEPLPRKAYRQQCATCRKGKVRKAHLHLAVAAGLSIGEVLDSAGAA